MAGDIRIAQVTLLNYAESHNRSNVSYTRLGSEMKHDC